MLMCMGATFYPHQMQVEDRMKKTLDIKKLYDLNFIIYILGLSILLGMVILALTVIPSDLNLIKILLTDIRTVTLNIYPIFLLMLILYFFTNRIWISFLSTSLITFVLAEVNRFKISFRDDPFVFSDVLLFNEAKGMLKQYKLFLDKISACAIGFIIVMTIICYILFKDYVKNKIFRISGIVFLVLIATLSCKKLYFENVELYESMWHSEFGNQWKSGNQYMSRGFIYSFIRSIPDAIDTPPEGYDKETAQKLLNEYESVSMDEDKKVHIISIMLEAYNDFSKFENVEFVIDPYKNFHVMQDEAYSGLLYTNIFAGGTVITERSFLTGYEYPEIEKRDTQSYIRYFKEQGYYTEAMHPCYGWFYDRKNINEYLGFDNFDYYENKYENISDDEIESMKYQGLLSDWDFFDYIIDGYENAVERKQKYFNFSVTYQNHGPYAASMEADQEYLLNKPEYMTEEYNILNNYLYGIYRTDLALEKLKKYIDEQNEPILLILFGDHNPWMGENNSVFEMLGVNLDLNTEEGAANYYQTPYVFYANHEAKKALQKEFLGEGDTVSPMFLMNELFEYIGIEGPAYLNYLSSVKDEYTVLNDIYVRKNGEYVLSGERSNDEILKQRKKIEYYVKKEKIEE
ncbi:MAG: sulfatase-like hydrolase/transferase [Schaedlerella sp.]|nr:sulfatase-like hydrolase/transferase [Schaedlerella sp.]